MFIQKVGGFERIINFEDGWDKRNRDPKKNYGVHSHGLRFLVRGNKGAVQFMMTTGWLPHIMRESLSFDENSYTLKGEAMAYDLGYHAYEPQFEGQCQISGNCHFLNGRPCYYDGTGLGAGLPFRILMSDGIEALWSFLENYYREIFEEKRGEKNE